MLRRGEEFFRGALPSRKAKIDHRLLSRPNFKTNDRSR